MLATTWRIVGVVLLAGATAGAAAPSRVADQPRTDAVRKEMKKFAGTWAVVAVESNGRKGAEEDLKPLRYVFDAGGKWKLRRDDETIAEGTYEVDPTKKPRTIDFKIVSTVSERDKGATSLGIYEIEGDTLKVCRDWPGEGKRPSDFSAAADSKQILGEYKREKAQ
jgi:uncharacterized protein (TIGR03067 family)